jgi:hypothetical protein
VPEYDSTCDTQTHIMRVQGLVSACQERLAKQVHTHDQSKLEEPEKSVFDFVTPKLKDLTYGSVDYNETLRMMGSALTHHYLSNRHHPEYFAEEIAGMNLLDLIEMLCDWKAASERHNDGNMEKSLEINQNRFAIEPQLAAILHNTARDMGWLEQ